MSSLEPRLLYASMTNHRLQHLYSFSKCLFDTKQSVLHLIGNSVTLEFADTLIKIYLIIQRTTVGVQIDKKRIPKQKKTQQTGNLRQHISPVDAECYTFCNASVKYLKCNGTMNIIYMAVRINILKILQQDCNIFPLFKKYLFLKQTSGLL